MLDRELDDSQLPYCREHDIAVLAYSPLALGLLSGKIGPEREFSAGDQRRTHPRFSKENRLLIAEMLETFCPIAEAHRATLAQLVIAWTIHQPGVTHALCGARNRQQAAENAAAGEIALSAEELAAMTRAIPAIE